MRPRTSATPSTRAAACGARARTCVEADVLVLIGTAAARGYAFGNELAARADRRNGRPPFARAAGDERAQARRQVAGLTKDARVLERLIDRFVVEAQRRYERRPLP